MVIKPKFKDIIQMYFKNEKCKKSKQNIKQKTACLLLTKWRVWLFMANKLQIAKMLITELNQNVCRQNDLNNFKIKNL